MIGLKTYLARLAPVLGQHDIMLYERQRTLVKLGLMKAAPGRGPGSGTKADAEAVSVLLISVLAGGFLVDTSVTASISKLESDQGKCPVTGATTFQEAVQRILDDEELAGSLNSLVLTRTYPPSAHIRFLAKKASADGEIIDSRFKYGGAAQRAQKKYRYHWEAGAIEVSSSIKPESLQQIAKDIAQIKKDGAL
jgi:hypothetical protein